MNGTAANLAEINLKTFIEVKHALDECDPEIQAVVADMLDIYRDKEASEDEKKRAINTMLEALFPSLAIDIIKTERCVSKESSAVVNESRLDGEEAVFSERLRDVMAKHGVTQEELGNRIGVGQSAISNMLTRECRPQQRTVVRLAEALGISKEELWPD